jgi:patatin-like phospholipase/acyl hydrolase
MAYKILSLDGGGLRGLISARLLQRLNDDDRISNFLAEVDLIVGASSGGILALALAAGLSPQEICHLYVSKGGKIFDDSIWDNVRDLGKTIGADYSNKVLKKELNNIFGEIKLADLTTKVAVPTFDLDNEHPDINKRMWKPKIFHNFSGEDSDGDTYVRDIALYTSSAPTYFPSADGYIDGGVFANNPSLIGIAQAISWHNISTERADFSDLVLLSVGTGISLNYISEKKLDWGYTQWVKPLINILMEGVSSVSDYQAAQLLGERYQRLQIIFDKDETIHLDDVKKIARMNEIATTYDTSDVVAWIDQYWS